MLKVYTDASTKGNPGPSGIGIVIVGHNLHQQLTKKIDEPLTNHQAEFQAVIFALEWLLEHHTQHELILFHSDSKIVVQTMMKRFTKNPDFLPFYQEIEQLLQNFKLIEFKWIPESQNKGADNLARQALRKILNGGKKND